MKLVIDIPDAQCEIILRSDETWAASCASKEAMMYAIKTGTQLPKGHGRLGDLDALRKEVSSWGMNDYEPSDFIDEIDRADTIIEADRGVSYEQKTEEEIH